MNLVLHALTKTFAYVSQGDDKYMIAAHFRTAVAPFTNMD